MPTSLTRYVQPASNYMRHPVRSVTHDTELSSVSLELNRFRISGVAVSEASATGSPVVGVVTRTDLLAHESGAVAGRTAGDVMTQEIISLAADTPIGDVARTMVDERIHRVFLVEGSHLVGVITPREMVRAIVDARHPTPISEYASRPVLAVLANISLRAAREHLQTEGVSGLVVVDAEWPIGIFTQREALAYRRMPGDVAIEGLYSPGLVCLAHTTSLHRAATQAMAANVTRVLSMRGYEVDGILSGMDLARAVAER